MASVLDKYGIKEVADITFYQADKNGKPAYPVLYIDTAKVSTIEQTAEETTANGGKGNPPLISWDYNKDINVTLEDALFSAKSLAIMFGNGTTTDVSGDNIMKTEVFTAEAPNGGSTAIQVSEIVNGGYGWATHFVGPDGKKYVKLNPKFYDENGVSVDECVPGDKYFCSYDLKISKGFVIRVSGDTFPGTYYVTGETYARSEANGEDEFFQFVLPKAKVLSENTITLEAEGDPSVFNMNLHVLRPASGDMMLLIKYDLESDGMDAGDAFELIHNHALNKPLGGDAATDVDDAARAQGIEDNAYINNAPYGNAQTQSTTDIGTYIVEEGGSTVNLVGVTGIATISSKPDWLTVTGADAEGAIALSIAEGAIDAHAHGDLVLIKGGTTYKAAVTGEYIA